MIDYLTKIPLLTLLENETASTGMTGIFSIVWLVIILVVFYFLLIRPQRKKEKEDAAMREKLEVGDEVVTAGGIVGIIFSIKDDTVVVETGSDRSKIRVMKWAIAKCNTEHDG